MGKRKQRRNGEYIKRKWGRGKGNGELAQRGKKRWKREERDKGLT